MSFTFKLDRKGGSEVLKSLVADEIHALGRQIAAAAGEGVEVNQYTTDRAGVAVGVPAARQAKHGALTKAASAAGLEVHMDSDGARVPSDGSQVTKNTGRTSRRWSPDELDLLFGQGLTNAEIAHRTGRSVSAVASKRGKRL